MSSRTVLLFAMATVLGAIGVSNRSPIAIPPVLASMVGSPIFFETNPIPLKYMMRRIGAIDRNEHRLPMVAASAALEARLDAVLDRAGLL